MTAGLATGVSDRLLLVIMVLAGCAHSGEFVAGLVSLEPAAGAQTQVNIVSTTGERVALEGEGAEELRRVPGAIVRVTGDIKGTGSRRRLQVDNYRIIDAGQGIPPHVGFLQWDSGRLLLVNAGEQAVVELIGPHALELRAYVGARVWVVGPILGKEKLEVLNFGILKPAGG